MKRLETDPPRSDAQIYDFFGLLCYHFRLHITGGGNLTPQEVVDILGWFLPWLRQLDQHDSRPRMLARRRLMRSRWQATSDELARSQVARQSAEWTAFSRMWRRAGTFFPPVPDAAESPFEPLERCGWGECLCSVHKPAHRMRICRGCWLVAYCGTKCQTSDWEHGEHQRRCRRRGA
ncbi:hypothetical protein PsYK624_094380 [Phanerochaete sordida]|uniref:MYND-type domain-containing protein n=1 Tax=Phanerochaete sordida TaxID=48140 RepID=A0A9P3LG44_9APHY|nr:hypothetical protein PsYK624_094380 [Phanerochaete sordida]